MNNLIELATTARASAYAPYSHYKVGAAVLDSDGKTWCGSNVENASYGLSICAERIAICKMVSEGGRELAKLALITNDGNFPCGACLQFMLEFAKDPAKVEIFIIHGSSNEVKLFHLSDLIPYGFRLA